MNEHTHWHADVEDLAFGVQPRVYSAGYKKLIAVVGNSEDPLESQDEWCSNARAIAAAPETAAECDRLLAVNAELVKALFKLHSVAAALKFEPDAGQPHPLKDGIYDQAMTQAFAALAKAKETP